MNESEFIVAADAALEAITRSVESSLARCDCEIKGEGVIELEFEDRSRIIINRHAAAKEIWVAARSGGFHFRFDGAQWTNTRDGSEIFSALSKLISLQSGQAVVLRGA